MVLADTIRSRYGGSHIAAIELFYRGVAARNDTVAGKVAAAGSIRVA